MPSYLAPCTAVLLMCLIIGRANGAVEEQSYFFGSRAVTDVLCQQMTLSKGTQTPATVSYNTNLTTKRIVMVTVNADKNSILGYTVQIASGAINSTTVTFNVVGAAYLPYNIIFDFYCNP
ncbi:uncharacterized protein LOC129724110 [Wyeomyia smithii]|uniref:uncharacterized protein LOC129724110 n=1 Tax=Wyeomyia smithii TaxID=174621 RepID=UPI002467E652|nr:uncharacterized protein LOC129724110 [Wyeomyia smithii]